MKKNQLYKIAEKFYVEYFLTYEEIARRLGINEKTVRRWKQGQNWEIKKANNLKQNKLIPTETYNYARRIFQKLSFDLEHYNRLDPSRMYIFINIFEELFKIQRNNEKLHKFFPKKSQNNDDTLTEEMMKDIKLSFRKQMILRNAFQIHSPEELNIK